MLGPQYAHSVLFHRFGSDGEPSLRLIARAKQFSWSDDWDASRALTVLGATRSFVLLLGALSGADQFTPTHGLVACRRRRCDR